ncbi:hypothetical protein BDF19DRAFT_212488 [Syncephalis fuscata]|nr:hypothetical protein BDF19DRAFT_212488 [Syncephalis fuscata]
MELPVNKSTSGHSKGSDGSNGSTKHASTHDSNGYTATQHNPLQSLLQRPQLKNNAIIMQQIDLLDTHADAITDLQLTEVPQPMLISADHSGIIKVFL